MQSKMLTKLNTHLSVFEEQFIGISIYNFDQMRFGEQLKIYSIPEWKDCYINYDILKIFVVIIKEISKTITYCDKVKKQIIQYQLHHQHRHNHFVDDLEELRHYLIDQINEQNRIFYHILTVQAEITELFYQMKVIQIEDRYEICVRMSNKNITKRILPLFLTYIQYSFIEISYISDMRQYNVEAERKILKKHKKNAMKFITTPLPIFQKIDRIAVIQQQYKNKIEDLYVQVNKDIPSKESRKLLREAAQKLDQADYLQYFIFGIGIGASIVLLGVLIFIIVYSNLSIENLSDQFGRDFPTWRGLGLFVLYIWILGMDVYFFEKYKINHRLIFKFEDHHYSSSSSVFKIAGIFTSLYMVLFLAYLMIEAKILVNIPMFPKEYFALILWLSFGVYLVMPLPIFNYLGRLYVIKLILRCLVSPFMGVQFIIVWMTDQWVSLITPFRDLNYTICYYNRLDFTNPAVNPCKDNSSFVYVLLPVTIAVGYRILQCIRMGYQQKKYWMTLHMANTLKYLASLITAIISFQYNQGAPSLLGLWIIASIFSTLYSYYWDLKNDWALLEPNQKNWLLRKYLTFQPKVVYYIIMVTNLIMRLAWTLTLSPSVSRTIGSPALLTFITGSIEIIRRGIWNLLRVEKEHLKNCNQFLALPDIKYLERKIDAKIDRKYEPQNKKALLANISKEDLINNEIDKRSLEMREIITKSYTNMIKKKIQERDIDEKTYKEGYEEEKIKLIKKIKSKIEAIKKNIIS